MGELHSFTNSSFLIPYRPPHPLTWPHMPTTLVPPKYASCVVLHFRFGELSQDLQHLQHTGNAKEHCQGNLTLAE